MFLLGVSELYLYPFLNHIHFHILEISDQFYFPFNRILYKIKYNRNFIQINILLTQEKKGPRMFCLYKRIANKTNFYSYSQPVAP